MNIHLNTMHERSSFSSLSRPPQQPGIFAAQHPHFTIQPCLLRSRKNTLVFLPLSGNWQLEMFMAAAAAATNP